MITFRHTPSPWHRNIKPARKYPIVFAGQNTHVAQVLSQGLDDAEVEANCDLIVAAPVLLEALVQISKLTKTLSLKEIADNAIAKARNNV